MIEKGRIEAVKNSVDIKTYIESRGILLKKNGKGYIGRCPFPSHEDKTPSFSVAPEEQLFHCFGCGKGGDIFRFVMELDSIDFPQAFKQIETHAPELPYKTKESKQQNRKRPDTSSSHVKLLARAIEFYHTTFCEDRRARDYCAKRGITDNNLFSTFKVGFANGTLLNLLPNDGDIIEQLKKIGILNEKGTEHFYGCVTFPLYNCAGDPCGIYGRRINGMGKAESADHLYLPGKRDGLFNWQAAKAHNSILLTEAIIDSVTLINHGLKNTIPCYGTNGLTEAHIKLFKHYKVTTIYICFDGDKSGSEGTHTVSARLKAKGIHVCLIDLPKGEDVNSFFLSTAEAPYKFKELVHMSNPSVCKAIKRKKEDYRATHHGFITIINGRSYEVIGISRIQTKLKATVKGIRYENSKKRFHVDTVDFFSARSRAFLISGLCNLFSEDEQTITEDMERLLEMVENYKKPKDAESSTKTELTEKEREIAMTLLKNPNMFDEILIDFETIGYTGEEMNKLLCYIAAISRKMEEPLSVMIQSRSAAGKSFLQDTVLSLIPDEDFIKYTRLTDQALFYKEKDSLMHKILAIEELDGMNGAIYSIRSIQSSKKITIAYTSKDAVTGKMKTEENTVQGPLVVFITTTQADIDGETASRFVFLSIDESKEMTEKILAKQRENYTKEGMLRKLAASLILEKHKAASRLLRPLGVINPYAHLLTFSSKSLRARRDHIKYQNLILAIAYLFQYQRKTMVIEFGGKSIECVVVTLDDIAKANKIAGEVFGRSLDELCPPSRRLLMIIKDMSTKECNDRKITSGVYRFHRKQIREYSGWSDFQIRTHIKQLEDLEYIYSVAGKRGKEYVYELIYPGGGEDGEPFLIGLIDIEELKEKAKAAGIRDDDPAPSRVKNRTTREKR
jgi:DNA primase catalytic core